MSKARYLGINLKLGDFSSSSSYLILMIGMILCVLPAPSQTPLSISQSPVQADHPTHQQAPLPANFPPSLTIAPEGIANAKLMPGSSISVRVFEEADLDGSYRLNNDGMIFLPLVGAIQVDSLSLRDAEVAIEKKLVSAGILINPHVVVNLVDYGTQSVVIAGEVTSPGRISTLAPLRLQEVLAMVGGTTPVASDQVLVHHLGQPSGSAEVVHYNPSEGNSAALDTVINPGDTVFVKKAGSVYVLGAVNRPGGFIMQEEGTLNVVQALALAYGTAPEAAIPRVRILRKGSNGQYTFIPVPLDKIQKGKADPPPLQTEDIVYVPPSTLKEVGITARSMLSGVPGAAVYRVP